jgi:hypothetical protein
MIGQAHVGMGIFPAPEDRGDFGGGVFWQASMHISNHCIYRAWLQKRMRRGERSGTGRQAFACLTSLNKSERNPPTLGVGQASNS